MVNGKVVLDDILIDFTRAINRKFNHLQIWRKQTLQVRLLPYLMIEIERTEENARKLVDMVEFVKTMVLALA